MFDEFSTARSIYNDELLPYAESVVSQITDTLVILYGGPKTGKRGLLIGTPSCAFEDGLLGVALSSVFGYIGSGTQGDDSFVVRLSLSLLRNEEVTDALRPPGPGIAPSPDEALACSEIVLSSAEEGMALLAARGPALLALSPDTHMVANVAVERITKEMVDVPAPSKFFKKPPVAREVRYEAKMSFVLVAATGTHTALTANTISARRDYANSQSLGALNQVVDALEKSAPRDAGFSKSKLTLLLRKALLGHIPAVFLASVAPYAPPQVDAVYTMRCALRFRSFAHAPAPTPTASALLMVKPAEPQLSDRTLPDPPADATSLMRSVRFSDALSSTSSSFAPSGNGNGSGTSDPAASPFFATRLHERAANRSSSANNTTTTTTQNPDLESTDDVLAMVEAMKSAVQSDLMGDTRKSLSPPPPPSSSTSPASSPEPPASLPSPSRTPNPAGAESSAAEGGGKRGRRGAGRGRFRDAASRVQHMSRATSRMRRGPGGRGRRSGKQQQGEDTLAAEEEDSDLHGDSDDLVIDTKTNDVGELKRQLKAAQEALAGHKMFRVTMRSTLRRVKGEVEALKDERAELEDKLREKVAREAKLLSSQTSETSRAVRAAKDEAKAAVEEVAKLKKQVHALKQKSLLRDKKWKEQTASKIAELQEHHASSVAHLKVLADKGKAVPKLEAEVKALNKEIEDRGEDVRTLSDEVLRLRKVAEQLAREAKGRHHRPSQRPGGASAGAGAGAGNGGGVPATREALAAALATAEQMATKVHVKDKQIAKLEAALHAARQEGMRGGDRRGGDGNGADAASRSVHLARASELEAMLHDEQAKLANASHSADGDGNRRVLVQLAESRAAVAIAESTIAQLRSALLDAHAELARVQGPVDPNTSLTSVGGGHSLNTSLDASSRMVDHELAMDEVTALPSTTSVTISYASPLRRSEQLDSLPSDVKDLLARVPEHEA